MITCRHNKNHSQKIKRKSGQRNVFDFLLLFNIMRPLLVLPGGARRFYLLTLFIYEKIQHRSSILEASLTLYRNIHETRASREAETLDRQRKIPVSSGDFSKEICPNFSIEVMGSISYFTQKSNFFPENQKKIQQHKTPPIQEESELRTNHICHDRQYP